METRIYKKIGQILLCLALCAGSAQAQVTIGSGEQPVKGALLDIKEQAANSDNVTSTRGGLLLPRVKLKNKSTLEPFIPITDPDWVNQATSRIKELHAGLIVYNLTTVNPFRPGVYVWDGSQWTPANAITLATGNGLQHSNDSLYPGGSLSQATTLDLDQALRINGTGALNVSGTINLNQALKYTYGQPGKGKILVSDDTGNASWQNNNALATTPSAIYASGVSLLLRTLTGNNWTNTRVSMMIPPGRWFVMVTMLAYVTDGNPGSDIFWVRSSFIEDGKTDIDANFFIGSNKLISSRIHPGMNIVNGYVIMKNDRQTPVKFWYNIGHVEILAGTANCILRTFGSSSWGENSIVAFALE
ncbi:MAG: hypothetical protein LBC40_06840 [Dysgonamonadaceae bacterium]|jgi:hypothetical protein|nr:hypothetical protein [Dysgonamonadaceae bacterium]